MWGAVRRLQGRCAGCTALLTSLLSVASFCKCDHSTLALLSWSSGCDYDCKDPSGVRNGDLASEWMVERDISNVPFIGLS